MSVCRQARLLVAPAVLAVLLIPLAARPAQAQWVDFNDQTSARLMVNPALGSADGEEKDYAWDDFDQDGDVDLVVVRKQPFTTPGRRANVLLMNEGGVLVDRTTALGSHSTVPSSQGLLDLTNDRDVAAVDLTGDGWVDLVTATTLTGGFAKYISHPRVYVNRGEDGSGNWLGFTFDDENRIPTMPTEPRFCSVSSGDVDNDGDEDLYFGDYEQGGPRPGDLDDRLLINDGTGYFTDESGARMTFTMRESSFAMSTAIADMNGDGRLDIVKDDALNSPQGVSISYNDGPSVGFFGSYEVPHAFSPYHIAVGDLNNDTMNDLVVTDDGPDRYRLNAGNGPDGLADFDPARTFSFLGGGFDDGFGGNNLIVDLNNDGFNDVLITDVDVDIPGCNRRMHIYRNLGNLPNVTLQEQQSGGEVAGIPTAMLRGTHDVAVFDIDGDGWKDMVVGRCTGTQVWMNDPPGGIVFTYPQGLPFFVSPGQAVTLQVQAVGQGTFMVAPGTATLHYRVNGGGFTSIAMSSLGSNVYEATMPALANCLDALEFYVSVDTTSSSTFTDPPTAPAATHRAVAANGTFIAYEQDFEGTIPGWTVVDTSLSTGSWQQAVPNATLVSGQPAAPSEDAQQGSTDVQCMVTQNGPPGGSAGVADVDGGPTDLVSPVFDLAGTDAFITYSRWFFCSNADDVLQVSVTGDGVGWTPVETVSYSPGLTNTWQVASFRVGEHVVPTATVQVRFRVSDNPNNSITEAAVDLFLVEQFDCGTCQPDIGFGGPGSSQFSVCGGDLSSGTTADILLTGAAPNAPTFVIADLVLSPTQVAGGTIVNINPFLVLQVTTDGNGEWSLPGLPGGGGPVSFYGQALYLDPSLPGGLGFSNAVRLDFLP